MALPSVGSPAAVYEVPAPPGEYPKLDDPTPVLPIHSPYWVAVPAVHWNVTVEDVNLEPLAGLVIVAGDEKAV